MRERLSPKAAVAWGLFCALIGAIPILGSLGILELDNAPDVPDWVIGCAGLLFVMAGAGIVNGYAIAGGVGPDGDLRRGTPLAVRLIQYALGLGVIGLFAAIFGWIAFAPGERRFSSTLSLPFLTRSSSGGDMVGRVLFGIVAVGSVVPFVALAIRALRSIRDDRSPRS